MWACVRDVDGPPDLDSLITFVLVISPFSLSVYNIFGDSCCFQFHVELAC